MSIRSNTRARLANGVELGYAFIFLTAFELNENGWFLDNF